jgi:hypothetical protein
VKTIARLVGTGDKTDCKCESPAHAGPPVTGRDLVGVRVVNFHPTQISRLYPVLPLTLERLELTSLQCTREMWGSIIEARVARQALFVTESPDRMVTAWPTGMRPGTMEELRAWRAKSLKQE